jgi:hypothetical protein
MSIVAMPASSARLIDLEIMFISRCFMDITPILHGYLNTLQHLPQVVLCLHPSATSCHSTFCCRFTLPYNGFTGLVSAFWLKPENLLVCPCPQAGTSGGICV